MQVNTPDVYGALFLSNFNLSFVFACDIRFSTSTFVLFDQQSSTTFVFFVCICLSFYSTLAFVISSDIQFIRACCLFKLVICFDVQLFHAPRSHRELRTSAKLERAYITKYVFAE